MGKLCPRCKENALHPEEGMRALSRKDNVTEICDACATTEAMEELANETAGN
jgi:hypothetical protein